MSFKYGFYNSLNGDRKYDAIQFGQLFDGIINDGVFMSIGGKLMVTASEGMQVAVDTGRAWFDSTWSFNDSIMVLEVEASEVILNRIDAVVLEVSADDTIRENSIKIIKGTPATEPLAPTLTDSGKLHQHPLALIYVAANATEITQSSITNKVGTSDCPFVTGILETMDIDALVAQWGIEWDEFMENQLGEFSKWFEAMKDQLTEDAAGNLQNQIYDIDKTVDSLNSKVDELNSKVDESASTVTYTATLGTTWTSATDYVTQAVTVSGLLATDNPIIDLVTTTAGFEAEQEAWGKVFKAVVSENSITFYASEATETAINLQIKVVR